MPGKPDRTARPSSGGAAARPADLDAVERELHRVVRALGPKLRVERKWMNDWYAGTDLILCIGSFSHHMGVEFWRGSSLAPDHPTLEGTGKNLRHLKVRSVGEARSPAVGAVVRSAIALDGASPKRTR